MTSFRVRSAAAAAAAVLALTLSACGDEADTDAESSDEVEATDADTEDGDAAEDTEAETEETTEDETDASTEEDSETGTRDNPLSLGKTAENADWSVTVNSVTLNADEEVMAENEFNDPAPEGSSYALINADVTYNGEESEMLMMGVDISYVSEGGETYNAGDSIAVTPEPLDLAAELYNGGTESGNVAVAVPDDGEGVVRVRLGLFDTEDAFFAVD